MIASLTFGNQPLSAWVFPIAVLAAYLIGSIPFGFLVARFKGIDIRKHGSGNIGATNVLRIMGKPWGFTVFGVDFFKGLGPVLAARFLAPSDGYWEFLPIAVAIAAILGHNYTPWLGFRGGKGIATSAGAFAGLSPFALLAAILVWLIVLALTRYVAVASIAAAVCLSITVSLLFFLRPHNTPLALLVLSLFITTLAIWRHRSNIARLRAGTENRFGKRPASKTAPLNPGRPSSAPPSSSHD